MSLMLFGGQAPPSTQPAKVDLSSPELALLSYLDAIEQGDFSAYLRIVVPLTEDERRAVEEATMMHTAVQQLIATTQQRLGDASAAKAREMLNRNNESAEALREAIEGEIWNIEGEDAILGEISPEIHFRRIGGEWRLLVPLQEHGEERAAHLNRMRQYREMIDKIADSADSGQISSPDELGEAIARLVPVVRVPAATEPTTRRN